MSEENQKDLMVELEGENISLAELAGEDLTSIAELRFQALPAGLYVFEVMSDPAPHLEAVESKGKKKPAALFQLRVIDVQGLKNPAEVPEGPLSLIDRTHRETMFISDMKSVGYVKAFVADMGCDNTGNMGGLPGKSGFLDATAGARFSAPIIHRKDKDDEDKVYVNIKRDKIVPLPRAASSEVATAVGA